MLCGTVVTDIVEVIAEGENYDLCMHGMKGYVLNYCCDSLKDPFIPSGGISIAVTNYNIYFNAMSLSLSSCGDITCERITSSVPPSSCPPMTNITIRASASNMLGEGPQTDPIIIGKCMHMHFKL